MAKNQSELLLSLSLSLFTSTMFRMFTISCDKQCSFKPSFILSATTSSLLGTGKTKIVLAKLHPLFPKIPELCFALEDGLVGLVDVQEAVGKKGGGSVSFEDLDQVEGIRWIEANEVKAIPSSLLLDSELGTDHECLEIGCQRRHLFCRRYKPRNPRFFKLLDSFYSSFFDPFPRSLFPTSAIDTFVSPL